MPWRVANFKGKQIWAETTTDGTPKVDGGRVPIRYSSSKGARIYRAGASRISLGSEPPIDLPDGVSADDAPARKSSTKQGFGSAGRRTTQQAALAADAARSLIRSVPDDTVLAFTDGACKGNPGPTGAGAWVRLPGGRVAESSRSLGSGTNNIGELTAIGMVLEICEEAGVDPKTSIAVFSDSKYANGVLVQGWKAKANRELILDLRERIGRWPGLRIHWIAGHVGVEGNERADELANAGVLGRSEVRWTR